MSQIAPSSSAPLAQALNSQATLFSSALVGLLVDRSGSMFPYTSQVTQGVNQLVTEQLKSKGAGHFTLAEFDHVFGTVLDKPFNQIESFKYNYEPRGGTCLYDSIAELTNNFEKKLAEMSKKMKVIIAVMTDGEDSGCKISLSEIKAIIEKKKSAGWEYLLIGALPKTVSMAESMGISSDRAAAFGEGNIAGTFKLISNKINAVRKGRAPAITKEEQTILALPASKSKTDL